MKENKVGIYDRDYARFTIGEDGELHNNIDYRYALTSSSQSKVSSVVKKKGIGSFLGKALAAGLSAGLTAGVLNLGFQALHGGINISYVTTPVVPSISASIPTVPASMKTGVHICYAGHLNDAGTYCTQDDTKISVAKLKNVLLMYYYPNIGSKQLISISSNGFPLGRMYSIIGSKKGNFGGYCPLVTALKISKVGVRQAAGATLTFSVKEKTHNIGSTSITLTN